MAVYSSAGASFLAVGLEAVGAGSFLDTGSEAGDGEADGSAAGLGASSFLVGASSGFVSYFLAGASSGFASSFLTYLAGFVSSDLGAGAAAGSSGLAATSSFLAGSA